MTRPPRRLGVALALAGLVACTAPEERFQEHLSRGEGYARQGETQKALLEYHSALKIRPDDADLNERVGDLLIEQRAPQDAAFFYREAHRLDPARSGAALKEARALLSTDPRRASRLVRQVVAEKPDDAFAQRTLSELALAQQQLDEAESAALRATELAPEDPAGWVQLGNVRAARVLAAQLDEHPGDALFEAALEAFQQADRAGGGLVSARIDRGRLYSAWAGHREDAERSFRDAIELAGQQGDAQARVAAGEALATQAARWGDSRLEAEALRGVVEASEGRIEAWQRLAVLAGDAESAGRVYTELLSRRADDPAAHVAYSRFLVRSGRIDAAIVHLEESIEDGVESPTLWEQLLLLHLAERRFADARATVVRMADAHPDHPRTRRGQARLALAAGRPAEAAGILRELVLEEEGFESQLLLAQAEHRLRNLERASAAIDRALLQSRQYRIDAAQLKARIHYDAREWGKVLATLDQMVARGLPLQGSEAVMRAVSLYETGDAAGGRRALMGVLEAGPRAGAAIEYAEREGARDPAGARAYLEAALEQNPTNRTLLEELTRRDLRAGRTAAAIERLDGVIEKHRVRPPILLLRADLLARTGSYDAAEADALRAFEAAPGSPEALDLLFRIYVAQDRIEEASRSFREADEAGVLHAGARLLLGRLELHSGDLEAARRTYEKVLEEDADLAVAQGDLAYLLALQGEDLERALELATAARERLGDDPGTAHRLGYVYLRSDRPAEALAEFERASQLAAGRDWSRPGPALYYHKGLALRALERDREAVEAFETALANGSDFPEAADARRQLAGGSGP